MYNCIPYQLFSLMEIVSKIFVFIQFTMRLLLAVLSIHAEFFFYAMNFNFWRNVVPTHR